MKSKSAADVGHVGRKVSRAAKAGDGSHDYCYRAFGLSIRSELPLAELAPSSGSVVDVTFRLRPIEPLRSVTPEEPAFDFGPDGQLLSWPSVGSFLIRDTSLVDIDPASGTDPELLSLPLLGPVTVWPYMPIP